MIKYNKVNYDNWFSEERYQTLKNFFYENFLNCDAEKIKRLLSGENGFICQYDRKTNKDTIWSSIYEINNNKIKIWRVEGNPKRKKFIEDKRFSRAMNFIL